MGDFLPKAAHPLIVVVLGDHNDITSYYKLLELGHFSSEFNESFFSGKI